MKLECCLGELIEVGRDEVLGISFGNRTIELDVVGGKNFTLQISQKNIDELRQMVDHIFTRYLTCGEKGNEEFLKKIQDMKDLPKTMRFKPKH